MILAAALMIGPLVFALVALRAGGREFSLAINVASVGAASFTLLGLLDLARTWPTTIVMGALLTLALFAWRGWGATVFLTAFAALALLPLAVQVHDPESPNRMLVIGSAWLLLTATAVCIGATVMLVLLRQSDISGETLLRRYSWIAVPSFAVVVVSALAWVLIGPSEAVSNPTAAQILTGELLPEPLASADWADTWRVDIVWLVAALAAASAYLAGVSWLRRRGEKWPDYRTLLWLLGLVLLVWVTSGAPARYADFLMSVQVLSLALVGIGIPLLLVGGNAHGLARSVLPERTDGTRGLREWIDWAAQLPLLRVLTRPLVAAVVLVGSWWAFYFTGWFRWAMYEYVGHQFTMVFFLFVGCVFAHSLFGAGAAQHRRAQLGRLVATLVVAAGLAALGLVIRAQSGLMVADWFGSTGREWGLTPLADQYLGGAVLWVAAGVPLLVSCVLLFIKWTRSDKVAPPPRIRKKLPAEDAAMAEYNAQLAALGTKGR